MSEPQIDHGDVHQRHYKHSDFAPKLRPGTEVGDENIQPAGGGEKRRKERGIRDWHRVGVKIPEPKPVSEIKKEASTAMAVWESRIEAKRYDELANAFRDLEDGLIEAQTWHVEKDNKSEQLEIDEIRAELKARLKLHRAYGIWKDHAHDSVGEIMEAFEKAEIKLDGEFFDTFFKKKEFKRELMKFMTKGEDPRYTDDHVIEELQQEIVRYGMDSSEVAQKRLAWEFFTITAMCAEMLDPGIKNQTEFRGVKKVINPRVAAYQDRGLAGTADPANLALLDETVDMVALKNQNGDVIDVEGRKLDGNIKTFADYLGMHNFFLFLSEYENGKFWRNQPPAVLEKVIERHQTLRDETHVNGIIELDSQGKPKRGEGGEYIPVAVPVDIEDLRLIDIDQLSGMHESEVLIGEAYQTWLDYCRKSEWSRNYVVKDILPNIGSIEAVKLIAEIGGEVEHVKKDKPIFQRHVAFERKSDLLDTMKSWAALRFMRTIEQGFPRDKGLQQLLNQEFYRYGGDAKRMRLLFRRSFSNESLAKEPVSVAQAATYLRLIYASQEAIDFSDNEAYYEFQFPEPISLRRVLERAVKSYGWIEEKNGQTFYDWLDEVRNEPQFSKWTWTEDEKNKTVFELQKKLVSAQTSGNRVEAIKYQNRLMFIGRFSESIYQYSAFQRDYFEFIARDAIDFFKTPETKLYQRFIQQELIERAANVGLRVYTPNDPRPGNRMQEVILGSVMNSYAGSGEYAPPSERDATNYPIYLEGDDRRRLWELIMMGTEGYIRARYETHGNNYPRHPKTQKELGVDLLMDNPEDRAKIVELFEQKGRTGKGFLKPDRLQEYRKILHCTSTEVTLHRLKRILFGIKDETVESIRNVYGETATGLLTSMPFFGPLIGKAQELNIAPVVSTAAELATFGPLAIPAAKLSMGVLGIPEAYLPGDFLSDLFFDLGGIHFSVVSLSVSGVLGAIINRKLIIEQGIHRFVRWNRIENTPVLNKLLFCRESLNVNRGDDVKAILDSRGL